MGNSLACNNSLRRNQRLLGTAWNKRNRSRL